jgi:hypothetical protein
MDLEVDAHIDAEGNPSNQKDHRLVGDRSSYVGGIEAERGNDSSATHSDASGCYSPRRDSDFSCEDEEPSSPFDSDLMKLKARLAAQRQGWTSGMDFPALSSPMDAALLRQKCRAQRRLSDM